MSLESAIFDYLTADAGVGALVLDRVYPVRLPEKSTLPAIVYHKVSASRLYTYDTYGTSDPFVQARVQFDCWGRTALEAIDVGTAVLVALSGYDGSLGGQPIQAGFAVDEFDTYEAATKFYRRVVDMRLLYEDDLEVLS